MTACLACGFNAHATVTASWTFQVDRDPPSLNARLFNGARGWMYRRERLAWEVAFKTERLVQRIPVAKVKRRITLTRRYAGRQQLRDRDNLAGGCKALLDALVREGLLKDDSEQYAEVHYKQERGEPRGLHVLLEEVTP